MPSIYRGKELQTDHELSSSASFSFKLWAEQFATLSYLQEDMHRGGRLLGARVLTVEEGRLHYRTRRGN